MMRTQKIDIAAIVRELPPANWELIEAVRKLPSELRIKPVLEQAEFVRARTKAEFRQHYPELNERELNLKVLEFLSGDRLPKEAWQMVQDS